MMQAPSHKHSVATGVTTPCKGVSASIPQFAENGSPHRVISTDTPTIFIVDDDGAIRETMRDLLEECGYDVECYSDGPAFLHGYRAGCRGCVLIDLMMPGMSGIALLGLLNARRINLPAVMISGNPPFQLAVAAMKAGAVDFVEKPFRGDVFLATVRAVLEQAASSTAHLDFRKAATQRVGSLTPRQREILDLVVAGHPTKNIAADLHISERTVDNHRAAIARKTGSKSLPAVIQTALCARCTIYR